MKTVEFEEAHSSDVYELKTVFGGIFEKQSLFLLKLLLKCMFSCHCEANLYLSQRNHHLGRYTSSNFQPGSASEKSVSYHSSKTLLINCEDG